MTKEQCYKELVALCAIKDEQLGAVTFVQNYVQLAFDGPAGGVSRSRMVLTRTGKPIVVWN
jgi:hypothetical protein